MLPNKESLDFKIDHLDKSSNTVLKMNKVYMDDEVSVKKPIHRKYEYTGDMTPIELIMINGRRYHPFSRDDQGRPLDRYGMPLNTLAAIEKYFGPTMTGKWVENIIFPRLNLIGFNAYNTIFTDCSYKSSVFTSNDQQVFQATYGSGEIIQDPQGRQFVGEEGLNALAQYVPEDGNMVIRFGPQVWIDHNGNISRVNRMDTDNEAVEFVQNINPMKIEEVQEAQDMLELANNK